MATPSKTVAMRLAALKKRVPILKRSATFAETSLKKDPKNKELAKKAKSKRKIADESDQELTDLKKLKAEKDFAELERKAKKKTNEAKRLLNAAAKRLSKARTQKKSAKTIKRQSR